MDSPEGRWASIDCLLERPGKFVGPGFEPGPELRQFLHDDCRCAWDGARLPSMDTIAHVYHALGVT